MENLFESLNHPDSVMFLLSALVCFLIGFISAWAMWSGQTKRYQREAADWKQKYENLSLEITNLRETLDLNTADLAKAKRESELALEQLAVIQTDKLKWQRDLDQSLEETAELQASIHSYQATIKDLNNQVISLETRNDQLELGTTSDGGSNEKLIQDKNSHDANMERLGYLEAKISQLGAENETLRSDAKKEDENLINLLKSYKDSTNRLGTLEKKMGRLVAENDALLIELAAFNSASTEEVPASNSEPMLASINPADKEAITGGAIPPSDAKNEVLAAIGNTIPSATADQKDDLTEIKGIGSFLEKKLNSLGIYAFEQISCLDANLIEKLTTAIEFFPGSIERDDWVGQATRLAQAKSGKAAASAVPAKTDDLKIVEGIGPKIAKLLNEAGIRTYSDLANSSLEQLKEVLRNAGDRYRIHDPSTWPDQARLAANSELDKLKEYQDFLSGGRGPDKN